MNKKRNSLFLANSQLKSALDLKRCEEMVHDLIAPKLPTSLVRSFQDQSAQNIVLPGHKCLLRTRSVVPVNFFDLR